MLNEDYFLLPHAHALSSFITPNLVNDAHDTTVDFTGDWLSFWLTPLLANPNFNNNRTVIVITFDETESYSINNKVYTLALGGGIPAHLVNTTDDTCTRIPTSHDQVVRP